MRKEFGQSGGSRLRRDLAWGLSLGLGIAAVIAIWVTIVRISSGPAPFERYAFTYGETLLLYAALGAFGGLELSFLRRFTVTKAGTILAGAVMGASLTWSMAVVSVGLSEALRTYMVVICLGVGALVGMMCAGVHIAIHRSAYGNGLAR